MRVLFLTRQQSSCIIFVQIIHNIDKYLQLLDILSLGNEVGYLVGCKCSEQRHFLFLPRLEEDTSKKVQADSLDPAWTLDFDHNAI